MNDSIGAAPRSVTAAPRLEARDIVVVRGALRILNGASLALQPASITCLSGASGSGKTTLLRVMASFVEPDSGSILMDGVDARTTRPREFRRRVAYLLQQPPMFEGTVADNVATGPRLRGMETSASELARLLDRVGLESAFGARVARELSGGERQRVALARALANEPRVLLLDEPTAALDPKSAEHVIALVRALANDGLTVLVVTHIEAHARALGGAHFTCEGGVIT